jgi:hypothetical protein
MAPTTEVENKVNEAVEGQGKLFHYLLSYRRNGHEGKLAQLGEGKDGSESDVEGNRQS